MRSAVLLGLLLVTCSPAYEDQGDAIGPEFAELEDPADVYSLVSIASDTLPCRFGGAWIESVSLLIRPDGTFSLSINRDPPGQRGDEVAGGFREEAGSPGCTRLLLWPHGDPDDIVSFQLCGDQIEYMDRDGLFIFERVH